MNKTMKDSGCKWIGTIPTNWNLVRVKDIIIPGKDGIRIGPFGSALTGKMQANGDYFVYGQYSLINNDFSYTKHKISSNLFKELQSYEVLPDDICLSMMGTIGKCKTVPQNIHQGIMDSHLIKVRLNSKVNSRFFEYVYDKDLGGVCFEQMNVNKKGSIMDGLNSSIVKELRFPLPPRKTQDAIVDYLDQKCSDIDSAITRQKELIEKLKEYKKSVITKAVTKGLDPNVEMKDSGIEWIGKIPINWIISRVKFYISIEHGTNPMTEGDIPVYGSGANSFKTCGEFKNGPTVLLGRKGTVDMPNYIEGKYWNVDTAFNTYAKHDFDLKYFYYLATCFNYHYYISQTTLPSMTQSDYLNMKIPVPPAIMQKQIVIYLDHKCSDIDSAIARSEALITKLEEYKKSVIFHAVTGKIDC